MANPLYSALGGSQRPQNIMQAFPQFMNQMKGKNPNEILNQLLSSGKVSQAQLDQAQKMAQQMQGQIESFKSMFGFK